VGDGDGGVLTWVPVTFPSLAVGHCRVARCGGLEGGRRGSVVVVVGSKQAMWEWLPAVSRFGLGRDGPEGGTYLLGDFPEG